MEPAETAKRLHGCQLLSDTLTSVAGDDTHARADPAESGQR